MSTQIQLRRGTTVDNSTFTGASGELIADTTKNILVLHDGSTVGGHPFDLPAHLAETVAEITLITEPYDQVTTTTVTFGFRPKLVEIDAVIMATDYASKGFKDDSHAYTSYKIVETGKVTIGTGAGTLYYNANNKLLGTATITDTGIEIAWALTGTLTGASGNRRLLISAWTH
ncbi:MAG: hypothetical protein WCY33_06410 [Clostridia bacterium]